MMTIEMVFIGGPMHRIKTRMSWIPAVNVFTDSRDGSIYVYVREETEYYFDQGLTTALAPHYHLLTSKMKNDMEVVGEV